MDTAGLDQVIDLGIESGSLEALAPGTILVGTSAAEDLGVGTGDTVTVTFPETGATTMRVAGTFSKGSLINASYVMTMPDFTANVTSTLDGADPDDQRPRRRPRRSQGGHRSAPSPTTRTSPSTTPPTSPRRLRTPSTSCSASSPRMLLLAVIVAILGIVNTLVLSVVERTRELGLLRAVGGTRRQVRTVVRRESVLMALLGALTGIALGTVSGIALSRALLDEGITEVQVPAGDPRPLPRHRRRRRRARRHRTRPARQQGRRPQSHHGRVSPPCTMPRTRDVADPRVRTEHGTPSDIRASSRGPPVRTGRRSGSSPMAQRSK